MSDTTMTIIAIFLAAILMFISPMITLAARNQEVAQVAVDTATADFVATIRTTGELTLDDYDKFIATISATGNTYDVELEFKILDENPGKKTSQTNATVIGENVYYSVYTTQILSVLTGSSGTYTLKEGDIVSVSVKNDSQTLYQVMMNAWANITGEDTYVISSSYSGQVTTTGTGN